MGREGGLLKKFLQEYSRMGSRLFRVNSGRGWTGKKCIPINEKSTVTLQKGDMVIKQYRPFHSGVPTGFSDLVGWTKVNITKDMIGRDIAVFTAIEAKTARVQATKQQAAFIRTVKLHGGISTIARSLDDVFKASSDYLKGGDDGQDRH